MQPSKEEVIAQFDLWNNALQTRDPKQVSALYGEGSILLPTLSNEVRHNHAEIEDYFVHFLAKGPVGTLLESNVRIYDELAINSGIYSFAFEDGTTATARFTFAYARQNDQWMIAEHHSSLLPN
ncbi:MAG: DUF4440 domain-containing protein [Kiritimatiellaceae bacterium TMED266]|nr:MAG: DUF4440 domain-containing protein [Kiritimatiellaceae bacterium TMED266]|tara:strand:- start:124 stop:495 length:372 start_codon:yes stop_codon:yes gene_type:complete